MSIIRDIVYSAVSHGAEFHKLCNEIGLAPNDLNDSDKLVPFEPAARVWDVAIRQTGDPLLGLHIGEEISPSILGMTGYLMQNCRTLVEALSMFCKFNNLYSTMLHYSALNEKEWSLVVFQPDGLWQKKYPESARQSVEISMSGLIRIFRTLAGKNVVPVKAEMVYSRRHAEEYERILGCPMRFKAERNALLFDLNNLLLPISRHDISLYTFFNDALQEKLAEITSGKTFTERTKELILTIFKGQVPSIEIAASSLHVTPRSLQRKLKEENTNYRELGNQIKRELCISMMTNSSLRVKDVAGFLGYSDSSAFRKAFKKWRVND